jgi:hypothetical protein
MVDCEKVREHLRQFDEAYAQCAQDDPPWDLIDVIVCDCQDLLAEIDKLEEANIYLHDHGKIEGWICTRCGADITAEMEKRGGDDA